MSGRIVAVMVPDWVEPYVGGRIPVVRESDHPKYQPGCRFDYGFLITALDEGYDVEINQE